MRAENAPLTGVIIAFLSPIDLPAFNIERHAHTPVSRVTPLLVAIARLDERLNVRTIQIRPHDSHAFAIGPVQLLVLRVDLQLLGCKGATRRNDRFEILAVEVGTFDGAVVCARVAHIGPVDVTGLRVHNYAVRKSPTL